MPNARKNLILVVLFCITLPASVVLSTHLASRTFERVKLRGQTLTVKGYAERPIRSDLALWSGSITERAPDIAGAYAKLEIDRAKLLAALAAAGFATDTVDIGEVRIVPQNKRDDRGNATNTIELYILAQRFSIQSKQVDQVAKASRRCSELIKDGVELSSDGPEYLYTQLNAVKMEMLGEATANARQRAEKVVTGSAAKLGPLQSASQGVFQITPAYSTEVSSAGENDTSAIDKSIKAVVTAEYGLD